MKENLFLDLFVVFFKSRIDIIWINKYNFCIIWLEKNSIVWYVIFVNNIYKGFGDWWMDGFVEW